MEIYRYRTKIMCISGEKNVFIKKKFQNYCFIVNKGEIKN